jgi:alpha-amylase
MYNRMSVLSVLLALLLLPLATCLTQSELRHRSIYQVLTDRFARPDEHMAPCDLARRRYCGGTWKGLERKLGYIQGMGFDTGERIGVAGCHVMSHHIMAGGSKGSC